MIFRIFVINYKRLDYVLEYKTNRQDTNQYKHLPDSGNKYI